MRAAAAVVVAAAIAACGQSAAPATTTEPIGNTATPGTTAIHDADDAIDRFVDAWTTDVRPTIPGHRDPLIGTIDASMREPGARSRYSAKAMPCTEATHGIEQFVADPDQMVLHGSLAEARGHAHCWQVLYICCMKADAGAALDATTGELLAVWRIPEG